MNRSERRRLEKLNRKAGSDTLLHDAARHHRTGALDEAEKHYRAFLDVSPGHAQALHLLGLVCHQTGRDREGAALIAQAETASPDDPEIPYNLGNCLMRDERPAEAAAAFERALKLRPGRADALNNLGTALQRLDRLDDAVAAYRNALDAEPSRIDALSNLAHAYQALGRREDAVFAYQQVLARQPDHATARHMIAAMTGETPGAAPDEFVRRLFDNYADRFDTHLTASLGYEPQRCVTALRNAAGEARRFTNVVDLGCGTGLVGSLVRSFVDRLTGVDLSPGMVAKAEARGVYDALAVAAIEPFLARSAETFDLFFAGDVFVYVGALEGVFAKAAERAAPDGWFAFSVEDADGDAFVLRPTGRYAHALGYVTKAANAAGWEIRATESITVRTENGSPIPGNVVVLHRR